MGHAVSAMMRINIHIEVDGRLLDRLLPMMSPAAVEEARRTWGPFPRFMCRAESAVDVQQHLEYVHAVPARVVWDDL
jgi:hypothetical protein